MPAPADWRELVQTLELQAHPEGGFYRETWRSTHSVDAAAFGRPEAGSRSAASESNLGKPISKKRLTFYGT